ncbi:Sec-independent protein translocase subunit TatA [Goodfellowiella coeruleoviolacea]|uniref:Sec-independent protein translocase protein TatA n=1 Tax=Goodfellowiella coeruleoviolacea TaxID=334858 RepID=A0AAE3GA57_9PSEU|nr:Sec-independent protein translocase subunit TatA [Goodfellowiella coeruleoviolacea]MCP2163689.1 sec-independent protein translocase protein TatA [Goodfellowiella coeruleoviolacea]
MGNLGVPELIIIAVVIVLLFGAKKMPDMARSIGRSMKIFKAETKGLRAEEEAEQPSAAAPQPQPQQPVAQPQQLPAAQPQVVQPAQPQASTPKSNVNN